MKSTEGNFDDPKVNELLIKHFIELRSVSPEGSTHVLDIQGLKDPNIKFWSQINLGFYLNSLNFFNGKDGIKYLRNAVNEFERNLKINFQQSEKEHFNDDVDFHKNIDKSTKPVSLNSIFKNGKKTK